MASLAWRLPEPPRPGSWLCCIAGSVQPSIPAQPHGTRTYPRKPPCLPVHPPTLRFLPAPLCEKLRLPPRGTPVPSGQPDCSDEPTRAFPAPGGKHAAKERKAPNACAFPAEPGLQLIGSGCRCAGMLEVKWGGRWSRVCRDGMSEPSVDGICQRLGCGPSITKPLQIVFTSRKEPPNAGLLKCTRPAAAPATCHWVPGNCTEYVIVFCSGEPGPPPWPPPSQGTSCPDLTFLFLFQSR